MGGMVDLDLLTRFDREARFAAEFPGLRREESPTLVRQVDLVGSSGAVIYSRLTADTVDTAVRGEIDYFRSIGQDFEWKVYAHDQPTDLTERLAGMGFIIDDAETVMVLDLESSWFKNTGEVSADVRRLTSPSELGEVSALKRRVSGSAANDPLAQLAFEMETAPNYLSVYMARLDGQPAATGWIRFPDNSAFASLWGGVTLPEARNRGLYTALVQARADEARARGFRYLTIDASPMSRPILARRGFTVLTYATACNWHG